jgi:hypothetical protein
LLHQAFAALRGATAGEVEASLRARAEARVSPNPWLDTALSMLEGWHAGLPDRPEDPDLDFPQFVRLLHAALRHQP